MDFNAIVHALFNSCGGLFIVVINININVAIVVDIRFKCCQPYIFTIHFPIQCSKSFNFLMLFDSVRLCYDGSECIVHMHTRFVHWKMNVCRQNVGKLHISITANMALALQFSVCCCCRLFLAFLVVVVAVIITYAAVGFPRQIALAVEGVVGVSLPISLVQPALALAPALIYFPNAPSRMHDSYRTHFIFA